MSFHERGAQEKHEKQQFRTIQMVVVAYSLIFTFILYNGWFHLFSQNGYALASLGSFLLSFLAWNLGRFIGLSDGGIASKTPLFILLLILSAAGVFNWMMITLEGNRISTQTVLSAQQRFEALKISAVKNNGDQKLATKKSDYDIKMQRFLNEVENPLNCGHGTAAAQRLVELKGVIPNLILPNVPHTPGNVNSCKNLALLYKVSIEQEWDSTPDGKALAAVQNQLAEITGEVDTVQQRLKDLKSAADHNGSSYILTMGKSELQELGNSYGSLLRKLDQFAPNNGLPTSLDTSSLSSLGEWSQIIPLIIARIGEASTYVYILLAAFMDWMLIYMFSHYRAQKSKQRSRPASPDVSASHF